MARTKQEKNFFSIALIKPEKYKKLQKKFFLKKWPALIGIHVITLKIYSIHPNSKNTDLPFLNANVVQNYSVPNVFLLVVLAKK